MLNCQRQLSARWGRTHLEDNVLGKDVLDASDDILRFTLGELDGLGAAAEYGPVVLEVGHLAELLRVGRCSRHSRGVARARALAVLAHLGRRRDQRDGL